MLKLKDSQIRTMVHAAIDKQKEVRAARALAATGAPSGGGRGGRMGA